MKPLSIKQIEEKTKEVLENGKWMLRRSNGGKSYGGFQWNPIGCWTEAPDWNRHPSCGGGLHGCNAESEGWYSSGKDIEFCATEDEINIDNEKIKCRKAMILYRNYLPRIISIKGSLYLSGCTLPDGIKLPDSIGGSLYLSGCTLPDGIKLPDSIGGSLYLSGCILPDSIKLPDSVGGYLYLSGCTLPDGIKLPDSIGGSLDLSGCTLPDSIKLPDSVGGSLDLRGCILPDGIKLPDSVGGSLYLIGCNLKKSTINKLVKKYNVIR